MIAACSEDAKVLTEGATVKNGEHLFILNAKVATVTWAVASVDQILQIATPWEWDQEMTSHVLRKYRLEVRSPPVVPRRKDLPICASLNARAAIALLEETVQSVGQMFLRDGSIAELEQRKTVQHVKVLLILLHTASAQTFRFDLISKILSSDSFIAESLI
jgi:hypothetical protein